MSTRIPILTPMRRFLLVFLFSLLVVASGRAAPWTTARVEAMAAAEQVVQSQIEELEDGFDATPDLDRYEAEYRAAIPKRAEAEISGKALAQRLEAAPLVFLSDQHTIAIAQANTVRILRQMARGKDLRLVIEWVDRSDQPALDAFSAGRMTLEDLRQAVDYDATWGFPWAGYADILKAARSLQVEILAVDSTRKRLSLGARDDRITETLAAHRSDHPEARYLVVYGVYHLAGKGHLPDKMAAAGFPPALTLVGDAPEAFWAAFSSHADLDRIRFLDLGSDLVYIRNGTPLERELSYRDYLLALFGMDEDDLSDQLYEAIPDESRFFRELHALD